MRIYAAVDFKNHEGKVIYAVCRLDLDYGLPVQVGGRDKWLFWTLTEARNAAESRADNDNRNGKPARVDFDYPLRFYATGSEGVENDR